LVAGLAAAGVAWAQDDQAPIHLRMPASPSPAAPASTPNATADHSAAPVIHLHRLKHVTAKVANTMPQRAKPQTTASIPFSLDGNAQPPAAPPAPVARVEPPAPQVQEPQPPAAHSPPPPARAVTHEASTAARGGGDHANLTKRGAILFDKNAPAPSPAQYHGLQILAGALNTALEAGASRIQIEAYGGAPGDKSSDARRLSLRRALAVRQLLIDDGIPSGRIDVRAMGGVDDRGPADRVDVFIRTG